MEPASSGAMRREESTLLLCRRPPPGTAPATDETVTVLACPAEPSATVTDGEWWSSGEEATIAQTRIGGARDGGDGGDGGGAGSCCCLRWKASLDVGVLSGEGRMSSLRHTVDALAAWWSGDSSLAACRYTGDSSLLAPVGGRGEESSA
jgi:hypothetical protein